MAKNTMNVTGRITVQIVAVNALGIADNAWRHVDSMAAAGKVVRWHFEHCPSVQYCVIGGGDDADMIERGDTDTWKKF